MSIVNRAILVVLLFAFSVQAAEQTEQKTDLKPLPANAPQIGVSLQFLVPNRLPEFLSPVTAYGPVVGIPVGDDQIRFEFLYASLNQFSLYWLDVCYRLTLRTPFFIGFLSGGFQYFHYSFPDSFDKFGPNVGTGLILAFTNNLQIDIGMRAFVQEKLIIGFGGTLAFLL